LSSSAARVKWQHRRVQSAKIALALARLSPRESEVPVSTAQAIRKLGFRKWYERELLQSHINLVLLLFATLGLLASAEVFTRKMGLADQLQVLGAAVASAAIGFFALRRYLRMLIHAEYVADQARCRGCDTYAKWELLEDEADGARLKVRCRKCDHRWQIDL
jgi:hypothetical protein